MSLDSYDAILIMLGVWVLVYAISKLLSLKKYGVEVNPLYLMLKTERLNSFLEKTASRHPRFWRIIADISVIIAVGEMLFSGYILVSNLLNFFYIPQQAQPVFPFIMGVTISFRWFPYLLIAIGLAITVHEVAHGIIASLEKITVKSAGIILAPITFGGFVEPDEEKFNNAPLTSKLRLVSIGSMTNLVAGILATLLIIGLFVPASGVLIMTVNENGAAYKAGMRPWDIIHSINSFGIQDLYDLNLFMMNVKPGDHLTVETSRGVRDVITDVSQSNSSRGAFGIECNNYAAIRYWDFSSQFSYNLYMTLHWTSLLMINLAVFNMLPLYPLDGEAYIYSLLKARVKKGLKEARTIVNIFSLTLFALNIGMSLLKFGLIQL